jgi:hypothetical protein
MGRCRYRDNYPVAKSNLIGNVVVVPLDWHVGPVPKLKVLRISPLAVRFITHDPG